MKIVRRIITFICILFLIPEIFRVIPNLKVEYSDKSIIYEINQSLLIDNDKFIVNRLITDDNYTYIEYKVIRFEEGWSFPESAISLIDSKGKKLQQRGSHSSGKVWGSEGVIKFEPAIKDVEPIILRFECYDRRYDLSLKLSKEGVIH